MNWVPVLDRLASRAALGIAGLACMILTAQGRLVAASLVDEVRFLRRPAGGQGAGESALVLDRHVYSSSDVDAQGYVAISPAKVPLAQLSVHLTLAQGDKVIARQTIDAPKEQMVAFLLPLRTLADGEYLMSSRVVGANEPSSSEWRFLKKSAGRVAESSQQGRVRLTLPSRDFLEDTRWPVRTGVPFPKGVLQDPARVRLLADGKEVSCQVDVRARWSPRGSIRWLGLTFVADYRKGKSPAYELEYGVAPGAIPAQPVAVEQDANSIAVTTGPLKFSIRKKEYNGIHAAWFDANHDGRYSGEEQVVAAGADAAPYVVDRAGVKYRSSRDRAVKVEVEEAGPVQCVVRVEGWFQADAGGRLGKFITYFETFAGQPLVFVNNTVVMTHDTRENALTDVAFPVAVRGGDFALGLDGKSLDGKRDRRVQLTQESTGKVRASLAQPAGQGNKLGGWADAGTRTLGVTLAAQYVWQRFPKAFSVDAGRLVFHSWPADLGDTFSDEEELKPNRIYMFLSAHEGPEMNLNLPPKYVNTFKATVPASDRETWRVLANPTGVNGQGVALNDIFVLHFRGQPLNAGEAAGLVKLVEKDPHAAVDPDWVGRSHVFGPMVGVDRTNYPQLETYMSKLFLSMVSWHLKDNDEYGVWNFGDVHSTWDWTKKQAASIHRVWLNAHYGQTDLAWELYGHYGDPDLLEWARINNHHTVNVDMVNYSDPERPIASVFEDGGKLFHRAGSVYHCKGLLHWGGDATFARHYSYVSGLLYSWFMTGNRRSRDGARLYEEGVIADSPNGAKGRDGQTFMGEAVEFYQNWWDPRMLELIKRQIDVLLTEPPSKQHALYWNVASFPRYYDLTGDPKMLQWLVEDPEFRTREASYFFSAYLFLVTGDRKYFAEMRNLYADIRNQYNNPDSTYDGMDDMRWVDRIQQIRQYFVMQKALKQEGRRIERPLNWGGEPIYNGAHVRIMGDVGKTTLGAMKEKGQSLLLNVAPEHKDKIQMIGPDDKQVALTSQIVDGKPALAVPGTGAAGIYKLTMPASLYKRPMIANAEEFFYLKKGQPYTLCAEGARAGGQITDGSQFDIAPLEDGAPLMLKIRVPKFPGYYELFGRDGNVIHGGTRGFGETDNIPIPPTGGPYTLLATRISSIIPDQDARAMPFGPR